MQRINNFSSGRVRWHGLALVCTLSTLAQIAQLGILPPLLALILQNRGIPAAQIGVFAAAPWLMILAVSRFVPRLITSLGLVRAGALAIAASIVSVAGMAAASDFWILLALNFAAGFGLILRWIVCDLWILQIAGERWRGRAIGTHETLMGLGIAVGPGMLVATGIDGAAPFAMCAGVLALALVPLPAALQWDARPAATKKSSDGDGFFVLFMILPTALAGAFVCGFIETSAISLLPASAAGLGMSAAAAALMVTAFGAGNTLLQFPLGWLADKISCARAQIVAAIVTLVGAVVFPLAIDGDNLQAGTGVLPWVVLFFWGGAAGGMNTLAVMEVGEKTGGARLVAALSTVAVAYTIGGVIGPAASGAALQIFPPHGFMLAAAVAAVAFLVVVGRRK